MATQKEAKIIFSFFTITVKKKNGKCGNPVWAQRGGAVGGEGLIITSQTWCESEVAEYPRERKKTTSPITGVGDVKNKKRGNV